MPEPVSMIVTIPPNEVQSTHPHPNPNPNPDPNPNPADATGAGASPLVESTMQPLAPFHACVHVERRRMAGARCREM